MCIYRYRPYLFLIATTIPFAATCCEQELLSSLDDAVINLTEEHQYDTALKIIEPLAECGHAPAQYWLGFAYYKVYGKNLDYRLAFKWYMRAALQGYTHAEMDVANAYSTGAGVEKSWQAAVYWYRIVAMKGNDPIHAQAQHSVARLLPATHTVAAWMWASIALANGWSIADHTIDSLAQNMSQQEIDLATECASLCVARSDCSCDGLDALWTPTTDSSQQ